MSDNENSKNKFAVCSLLLFIALFLQLNWKVGFGWAPELVMASLIIFGLYLGVLEMTVLSALGVFILNWRPVPGYEILFFFFVPFLNIFARRIFPWRTELNNIAGIILSVSIFYSISNPGGIAANSYLFALIILITAGFGAAVFQILNYFYKISVI